MITHFYNEIDPHAAAWLRELIAMKLIPFGVVDERSITELQPSDLHGYTQCHFFCGIAGWPLALQLAGVPATQPLWTGSCPCQPFSASGKQQGSSDERHLWPAFFRLIRECQPGLVIGEQVASSLIVGKVGGKSQATDVPVWLDGVSDDLESAGYSCGSVVLAASSVGAPHIRQRLFWMADANSNGCDQTRRCESSTGDDGAFGNGVIGRLAHSNLDGCSEYERESRGREATCPHDAAERGRIGGMVQPLGAGLEGHAGHAGHGGDGREPGRLGAQSERSASAAGCAGDAFGGVGLTESDEQRRKRQSGEVVRRNVEAGRSGSWSDFDILPCRDGKARRVERGTFPLVARLPGPVVHSGYPGLPIHPAEAQATAEARVMRLKGYGNAIIPELAAQFILATLDCISPQ